MENKIIGYGGTYGTHISYLITEIFKYKYCLPKKMAIIKYISMDAETAEMYDELKKEHNMSKEIRGFIKKLYREWKGDMNGEKDEHISQ